MTPRLIARLCYKALAVYTLINAISFLSIAPMSFAQIYSFSGQWWIQAASILASCAPFLQIAIAVWLWRKADVVAAWTFGYDIQDEPGEPDGAPVSLTADLVQRIILSSLGVWVLINAIPETLSSLAWVVFTSELLGDEARAIRPQSIRAAVGLVTRLAIGFWLLFGSAGLVRVLRRFRDVGLEESGRPERRVADRGEDAAD